MEKSVELQFGSPKYILPKVYHTALSHKPAPEGSRRMYDNLLLAPGLDLKLVYRTGYLVVALSFILAFALAYM